MDAFALGLGTTFPYRDGHLERFYHCILPDDDALLAHIRELGLDSELLWRETLMGFMYQRKTYPLNTPMDLLRFSPLTILERIRMGFMGLRAKRLGMSPALDSITAEQWVRGNPDMALEVTHHGDTVSVRDVLVHMVEEYARHCGHADLLRECIDGRTGQ